MTEASVLRPPFDPAFNFPRGPPGFEIKEELDLSSLRQLNDPAIFNAEAVLAKFPDFTHTDLTSAAVKELDDNVIPLSLFQTERSKSKTNLPVILFMHGGGQVTGNRFFGVEDVIRLVPATEDVIVASVEYRLAPEHRAPAGAYDCYAALVYITEHATELGVDPSKIVLYGAAGGAAVAAATSLLARKRQYPAIRAQVLHIPMLDDRDDSVSWKQFETGTLWAGKTNRQAWDLVLGLEKGDVDEIRCAGRATDLSNLPPTFIDVGACEVFRDKAVEFASLIWKSGGIAELHVWPGVYHGGSTFEPEVAVSKAATNAQRVYIRRVLELEAVPTSSL